jgi:AcrR family transcriptional regulator
MARPSRGERLVQIADAALRGFTERGFRLTQVADIARLAGVAPGTIYLFAEGKESLFWLALARAMDLPLDEVVGEPPTASQLQARFAPNGASPSLRHFLDGSSSLPPLERVLGELWMTIEQAAAAINLVERCAGDWPELAHEFYAVLRPTLLGNLSEYLVAAAESGACRRAPNPQLAARVIVETIAWFAMHRLGDADGKYYLATEARDAALDALYHAYGPPEKVGPCLNPLGEEIQ